MLRADFMMSWYMLQALKQYVRVVYHPFLSADYTTAKGQPLAIVFMSSFAEGTRGVNLGEMDDDVISKRNMQGKGPFAHEFRVEVCDKKTGTESDARLDIEALQARWCLPFSPSCACSLHVSRCPWLLRVMQSSCRGVNNNIAVSVHIRTIQCTVSHFNHLIMGRRLLHNLGCPACLVRPDASLRQSTGVLICREG